MIRRYYIEASDVPNATEDECALAEQLIDAYVGFQHQFFPNEVIGKVSASLDHAVVDANATTALGVAAGTYQDCVIEIIGGAGAGQVRRITGSDGTAHSVTFEGEPFDPGLDESSIFKIYQFGKFPRRSDARSYNNAWYKTIPQAVKEATIAQVQFIQEQGDDYFSGGDSGVQSESIGNYSYNLGSSASAAAFVALVSPKARALLRGIKNSKGKLTSGGQVGFPVWRNGPWLTDGS